MREASVMFMCRTSGNRNLFRFLPLSLAALALGMSLLSPVPACGALGQDSVPLVHDGYLILRLRVGHAGMTAAQRVTQVEQRLQHAMADYFADERKDPAADLRVVVQGPEVVIATPRRVLLTVTEHDARANNSAQESLAELWRERLVKALIIATRTG